DDLPNRLSTPEAVGQLLQAVDDARALPPRDELQALFDQLRPAALGAVFTWMTKARNEQVRAIMADVAARLASANTAELVKLIDSSDVAVSSEAVRRCGMLQAQAAVTPLTRVMAE